MFLVSGPDLVREACKAGLMGVLPRQNARSLERFDQWLGDIRAGLAADEAARPGVVHGPLAVNLTGRVSPDDIPANLEICARHGVEIVVSAAGDPTELTKRVHEWGGQVFHDVTTWRHAEKAIAAGVDGLVCIGSGGGGHAGTVSHLILVPRLRAIFDGTIVMAGAVAHGAAIRAAEVLGADLSYVGTRFIASEESLAPPEYKRMLVEATSDDLVFTPFGGGGPARWLRPSAAALGLDLDGELAARTRDGVRPWKDVWSAGQGVDLIEDVAPVAVLVDRLRVEYDAASAVPVRTATAVAPG
ncbi:nitronate monooxygenase [Rhodococcus sp. BP-332]|uniref:NAD(P)H-dependent flavin oxidoreductase n=1 Tax=Rhodococcus sp. BP-332 TaxID=2739447 RepID=UPI001C9B040F|nr:nitronate monooxygenase [Rhodococcus sp. BP-332]MBY6679290.1 nitronate monooxygenase [Rhodococcus sp. BP-332]